MIFHHPLPFTANPEAGSQLRPHKMKRAFEQLGYDVFLIAGTGYERKMAIQTVVDQVRKGEPFEFVYSEPPSAPIAVVNHDMWQVWLDLGFLRWCHQQSIPVGLFYRDVYWRFEVYRQSAGWHKRLISLPLFWFEWLSYYRWVDHLFLPSLKMTAALPSTWPASRCSALPPGCEPTANELKQEPNNKLTLFYVGGVTPPLYDLTPIFTAVRDLTGVGLTVCCRRAEWEEVQAYYRPYLSAQVKVIHAQSSELAEYYAQADAFSLVRQDHPYLTFAMPVKVFESLGYGLPIITTAGTAAAEMIERDGIGWVVSDPQEIRNLLLQLQAEPDQLIQKRRQAMEMRHQHTWLQRARTVVKTLTNQELPVS